MRVRYAIIVSTLLLTAVTQTVAPAQPASNTDSQAPPQPAAAQAAMQAAPPSAVPTLKVYTRETIVDITVTDAKGNPVHGLTRDDFTVKEDNKPQSIRSFHEYGSEPVAAPAKLPPDTYSNIQSPAPSSALNVFLLDFVNSAPDFPPDVANPPGRIKGLAGLSFAIRRQHFMKVDAIHYMDRIPTGTRVMLLGMFQPGSLHVLQGVTSDPAILSASIEATHYGTQSTANTQQAWCSQQEQRNRSTLESFQQIAASLAPLKGRKNLIWFTSGLRTMTEPAFHPPCLPDYSEDLAKAYALLATAQVSVFPIGINGVEGLSSEAAADLMSMETIAERTGGAAFYNSNDLAGLISQAVDKGSSYYTLTYSPPGQKYNWAHHSIKVELVATAPPGLHLVYRKTYDAVDPATIKPVPGLTLALEPGASGPPDMRVQMTRAMPTSDALPFDVKVEPDTEPLKADTSAVVGVLSSKLQGKPLTRYTLQYAILGSGIALPKGQGGLEFDLAAYDADGNLVTSLRQAIKLSLTPQDQLDLISAAFPYTQQIDLPSGQLFLRIGVLDRTSNKLGTLEIPITVPKK